MTRSSVAEGTGSRVCRCPKSLSLKISHSCQRSGFLTRADQSQDFTLWVKVTQAPKERSGVLLPRNTAVARCVPLRCSGDAREDAPRPSASAPQPPGLRRCSPAPRPSTAAPQPRQPGQRLGREMAPRVPVTRGCVCLRCLILRIK